MTRGFLTALMIGLTMASPSGIIHAGEHGEGNRYTIMEQRSIEDAVRICAERVMSLEGVVGCAEGLCDGRPCIKVLVRTMTPDILENIPHEIAGYTVEVVEAGTLEALPEEEP